MDLEIRGFIKAVNKRTCAVCTVMCFCLSICKLISMKTYARKCLFCVSENCNMQNSQYGNKHVMPRFGNGSIHELGKLPFLLL